jgi:hypothetical protein
VAITPKGRLLVSLMCPRNATRRCGATGTVTLGRVRHQVRVSGLAKGRGVVRSFALTAAQRRSLRGKRAIRVPVRLTSPSSQRTARTHRVRVVVPRALRSRPRPRPRPRGVSRTPSATRPPR